MARLSHCFILLAGLLAHALVLLPATANAESKAITQANRMILKRNYEATAALLLPAAKAGNAEAQYRLGNLHLIGLGVGRDDAIARDLLVQSAAAGNSKAQRLLSRLKTQSFTRTGTIIRPEKANGGAFVPPVKASDLDGTGNTWLVSATARGQIKALTSLATSVKASALPLLSAAAAGQADAAMLLIQSGAPINAADNEGRTALMLSAASNSPVMTANLLAEGADADRRDKSGETALHHAIRHCNVEAAVAVLRNSRLPDEAIPGSPYLHLALRHCLETSLLEALLPYVDTNRVDDRGRSALWYAALKGQTQAAVRLIGEDAEVSLIDADGMTALHAAAGRCHVQILDELLRAKADANAAARDGNTPLMLAAASNCKQGVERLIAAGAAINAPNSQGDTALLVAVSSSSSDAVKLLLAAEADSKARNSRRETAASLAQRLGNDGIIAMLASP